MHLIEGEWVKIAENPQSGVSTWAMSEGEDIHIQERQDLSVLLDENKALMNMSNKTWKGDKLHSVARIPLVMLHDKNSGIGEAMREGDETYIKKVLNDGDNVNLRTKGGTL